jgi:phosphoribosyl 1,2-cyclic phosphate phosphodiesterase
MRSIIYRQEKSIPLYAGARVVAHLEREFTYLFTKTSYQEIPNFEVHLIEYDAFEVEGLTVVPIRVHHKNLPIWGFRIGALAYITDAKVITEEEVDKMRGITVLVVNALQQEPHSAHFNLQESLVFAQKVGAQVTYLTHINHLLGCHQEVSKKLPSGIHLAYDGLQLSV